MSTSKGYDSGTPILVARAADNDGRISGTYICPTDGVFCGISYTRSGNASCNVKVNGGNAEQTFIITATYSGNSKIVLVYCKAGDSVSYSAGASGMTGTGALFIKLE